MSANPYFQDVLAKERMDEMERFADRRRLLAEARKAQGEKDFRSHRSLLLLVPVLLGLAAVIF